ncbi:MAG: alpha/beta fold hydrolase [Acidobacteriota bacterium]
MNINFRSRFAILAILLLGITSAFAQKLESSATNGTLSIVQINSRLQKLFGKYSPTYSAGLPITSVVSDINLTKILYTSTDEDGKRVILSGLIAIPTTGAPNGLVVFCHGTIQDRDASPSKWKGKEDGSEAETAALAFASGGYAVVIPDYLGLGDHKATHPYPRNIINSQSAVDIIEPARALARKQNYNIGSKLFVTGYSEGGGVAMAATQKLERMSGAVYQVEKSAPASGPYDVAGATREFMLVQPTDQIGFTVRVYLLAYAAYYLRKHSNIKITDYFKPAMANSIWLNFNRNPSDETLVKALGLTAVLMRAKNDLRNVITPRFLKALQTTDRKDPLVAALLNDNVFDWAPKTPMLLINLEGDGVVSPENTNNSINAMRKRGVGSDSLRRLIIRDASLGHLNAVPAAMSAARRFFDNGFDGVREAQ